MHLFTSFAVGTVERRVGGPKKQCMGPGGKASPFALLVVEGARRDLVVVRRVAALVICPAEW